MELAHMIMEADESKIFTGNVQFKDHQAGRVDGPV